MNAWVARLLTGAGQFDLAVAGSMSHDGNGLAASASYGYGSRLFSASVTTRGMSAHYSNISVNPSDNRDTFDGTANVSVPVGHRATVTTSYTLGLSRDSGLTTRVGVQSNFTVTREVNLGLNVGRSTNPDGSSPFDAFAVVNVQLGRWTVSAGETLAAKDWETSLNVNDPVPIGNGFGFQASATQGEHTQFVGSTYTDSSVVTELQASSNSDANSSASLVASNSCDLSVTTNVAFGAYDPIGTNSATPLDATGVIQVACTSGAPYTLTLDQGTHAASGSTTSVPLRQMASGSYKLPYFLYQNSGYSTVWGDTGGTGVSATGTSNYVTHTVYGQIPAGKAAGVGSYTDTVTVTASY